MSVPRFVLGKVVSLDVARLLENIELPKKQDGAGIKVFVSYSHKDEELRAELDTHLKLLQRTGLIQIWHDRRIPPGNAWSQEIDRELQAADLIIFLISADFLASDYSYEVEMTSAMKRHEEDDARVVPVIVRDCNWSKAPFAKLQALPEEPCLWKLWPDRDMAWRNVASGIETIASMLARQRHQ